MIFIYFKAIYSLEIFIMNFISLEYLEFIVYCLLLMKINNYNSTIIYNKLIFYLQLYYFSNH